MSRSYVVPESEFRTAHPTGAKSRGLKVKSDFAVVDGCNAPAGCPVAAADSTRGHAGWLQWFRG